MLRARAGLPPVPSRKRPVMIVISLLLLASLAYWAFQARSVEPAPAPETPAETVFEIAPEERLTLTPQDLRRSVSLSGTLSPLNRATVSAETSGVVREVAVSVGDAVKRGDVLVRLATEALTIELDAARSSAEATRAQAALAESSAERARALAARGVASAAAADEAEGSLANLRAALAAQEDQVRAAELRLRDATVLAPIDGIVSERLVDPGEYAAPGAALLEVVDPSVMRLEARAPVGAAGDVRVGMPVMIRASGGVEGRGEVSALSPVATEGARSLRLFADFDNPSGALLGGAFATGSVITASQDGVLAVPAEAIREDDEGPHVLRVRDGRLERAGVELGDEWPGGLVEVIGGLSGGDTIISAPLPDLTAGQPITLPED